MKVEAFHMAYTLFNERAINFGLKYLGRDSQRPQHGHKHLQEKRHDGRKCLDMKDGSDVCRLSVVKLRKNAIQSSISLDPTQTCKRAIEEQITQRKEVDKDNCRPLAWRA